MKYLLLALTALLAVPASYGQVNTVKTAGTGMYYIQTETGDTLHVRGVTPFYNDFHVAQLDAMVYSAETLEQVYVRQVPAEFRINADFGYYDDHYVEVPIDTVYFENKDHNLPVHHEWSHHVTEDGQFVRLQAVSMGTNTRFAYYCKDTVTGQQSIFQRSESFEHAPGDTLRDVVWTDCNTEFMYHVRSWTLDENNWTYENYDRFNISLFAPEEDNVFFTDFSDYDINEWQNTWGDLTWYVNDETLYIDQPRNIARLKWLQIPEHRNARFRIVETLHDSHGTGVHTGLRVSDEDRQYAVETYIQLTGMGVSTFFNGGWENPIDFPFDWSYGQTVEYELILVNDTMTIRYNGEEYTYSHPDIGNTPNGFFAFGSTGAGTYIIHEIEIEILD
jgi:hypothetical protein